MSKEIATQQTGLIGSTLYASVDKLGLRWNGSAFETVLLANWTTYAILMSEATGTGYFSVDMPAAITAGVLKITVYKRAGGTAAATDIVVASGSIDWTGSAESTLATAPVDSGTAQAGSLTTITLKSTSIALDVTKGVYRVFITGGTGVGQDAPVLSYVSGTKVATLDGSWAVAPDSTSTYALFFSAGELSTKDIGRTWDALRSAHTVSASYGADLSTYAGGAVASVTAAVNLNLAQAITDVQTATVGGALAGAWTAWGNAIRSVAGKTFGIFGPGNSTATASKSWTLDDGSNPTSRT